MGRRSKAWGETGLPPLRQYWQAINREERAAKERQRTYHKTYDKSGTAHHPAGGDTCRHRIGISAGDPDPPAVRWQDAQAAEIAERVEKFRERWAEPTPEQMKDLVALTTKPTRPYRQRYAGIFRQIALNNGLHPIRDRLLIRQLMAQIVYQAKQIKRQAPRAKYRNMEVELCDGRLTVRGVWTSAGPTM